LLLAQDTDADVRGGLAAKIAMVAPELNVAESSKIYAQTHEALATLARDQIPKSARSFPTPSRTLSMRLQ